MPLDRYAYTPHTYMDVPKSRVLGTLEKGIIKIGIMKIQFASS